MAVCYKPHHENHPINDVHIKKLPIDWVMKPLSLIAAKGKTSFVDGPFGSDLKNNEYQDEGIPLIQLNNISIGKHVLQNIKFITEEKMQQLSRHIAKPSDIVIAKMADPVARATVVNDKFEKYVIVADCVKLTLDTSIADLNYVVYAINSKEVNSSAVLVSTGTTRIRINLAELKNLKIPFPPLFIQQRIANFLDHETAKIDTLIAKQEKLIELLKEKRQAVIFHAVARGLNSDVPMKDSGVEWLGEVPEHWDVLAIKRLTQVKRGASPRPIDDPKYFDENGEYAWVRIADVSKSDMYLVNTVQTLSDLGSSLSVKLEPNKLFVSIAGTVGKPCISGKKLCIHDGFVYFPELKIDHHYLYYIFEAGEAYKGLGKMGTQLNLNTDTVGEIKIGLPPQEEIEDIVAFIKISCEKFDLLLNKAINSIELMQERKTALISAAVTGKIDVRNWSQL